MDDKSRNSSYKHILKYTGMFGGVQVLSIVVEIIRNKFVAVMLGPSGMGLVSIYNSAMRMVADSTSLGVATSGVRNLSAAYEHGDSGEINRWMCIVRTWALVTAILGMVVCMALSPLLSEVVFDNGDKTLAFILLSPIVACMAITGGELAVLKATRQLKKLASVTITNVIVALVLTLPVYALMGMDGIVPLLVAMSLLQMIVTVLKSTSTYPYSMPSMDLLAEGVPMVKLGIVFVLAAVCGSAADFIIRSYLSANSTIATVGLYNAGFMMTMTYAGMIFSAMETDYFPRLSACCKQQSSMNITVNRQVEVSLMIISPLLVVFTFLLPIGLPLLYSGKFLSVLDMMHIMVIAMYMRAVKLPIAYLPLAHGDSLLYLLMEALYAVAIVVAVMFCFDIYGLTGTGIAIALVSVADFFMLWFAMKVRYDFSLAYHLKWYIAIQVTIGVASLVSTLCLDGWVYCAAGIVLALLSSVLSWKNIKGRVKRE